MENKRFFEESKKQSEIKSDIVSKYFDAWAQVIISTKIDIQHHEKKIAYIDLFAGPGRYSDGTISTPLMVLEKAIENEQLRQCLVTLFNDKDEANSNSLEDAIKRLPALRNSDTNPRCKPKKLEKKSSKCSKKCG